jgi:nitroimidazol reductase NimA-like FMN-containing flavoprotein (pyridoxamine 5'-phosphate oxidase superfamily)
MLVDEGLELLTEAQCRDLLAAGKVGRVGITLGAMPAIFPVNFVMIDGSVVFVHRGQAGGAARGGGAFGR